MQFAFPYASTIHYNSELAFQLMGWSWLIYETDGPWRGSLEAIFEQTATTLSPLENELVPKAVKSVGPFGTLIAIEGTTTIEQWLYAAFAVSVVPVAHATGNTLAPFELYAETLYLALKDTIDKATPICLTGHSLGGAVAMILAHKLKTNGWNVINVYTFGAPRVADVLFVNNYFVQTFNVRNEGDIVCAMPHPYFEVTKNPLTGQAWIIPMFIVGKVMLYSSIHPANTMWQNLRESTPLMFYKRQTSTSVAAHGRTRYLRNIWNRIQNKDKQENKTLATLLQANGAGDFPTS